MFNNPKSLDEAKKFYSQIFENEIALFYDYGYTVPLMKLAAWAIQIASIKDFSQDGELSNLYLQILESNSLDKLTQTIVNKQIDTKVLFNFCRKVLHNLNSYTSNLERVIKALNKVINLKEVYLNEPLIINAEPIEPIPSHLELKARFYANSLYYRLNTAKSFNTNSAPLAVITQWVPDLEAIIAILHYVKVHKIQLAGASYINSITPLDSKNKLAITSFDDWHHYIIKPAKKYRYPQIYSESIQLMLKTLYAIDFNDLAIKQKACKSFHSFLDEIAKEDLKEHLFIRASKTITNNKQLLVPKQLQTLAIKNKQAQKPAQVKEPKSSSFFTTLIDRLIGDLEEQALENKDNKKTNKQKPVISLNPDMIKEIEQRQQLFTTNNQSTNIRQSIYEDFCKQEALLFIQQNKWDKLAKEERLNLSQLAKERHILEITKTNIEKLFKQKYLINPKDKHLGQISLNVIDYLVHNLETNINTQKQGKLLTKLKLINKHYKDVLALPNIDNNDLMQTYQNWLNSICLYFYKENNHYYLNIIREVEDLFISIWKEIEKQLTA